MSQLKAKSELNRAAADILQDKSYYPSVVHCAYYSCIQRIKYILLSKYNLTEADLLQERTALSSTTSKPLGLHEYLINKITKELLKNKKDWKSFNTDILQLKKLRVNSDYEDVQIDFSKGKTSIDLSDSVLKGLIKNF